MKQAGVILCLAAAGGVWAWALLGPKEAKLEALPARFEGRYELAGFDAPTGRPMDNPLPPGQAHIFTFRADGTYVFSVSGSSDYEILKREGIVTVDSGGVLTITPISTNRIEDRAPPERFMAEWLQDETGPILALRHLGQGYTFRLRRTAQ